MSGEQRARTVRRHDDGFTLIELMIVIFIIAILIAVTMPVFIGASTRAKDRAAQENIQNAFKAAKVVYTDNARYSDATTAALTAAAGKGQLVFVDGGTDPHDPSTVSVDNTLGADEILIGGYSRSGKCFYIDDNIDAQTQYATLDAAGGCSAAGAPAPGDPHWKAQW
jgi:prepilin-type N-terminal cleavage/methylation domain-containing protein